MVLAITLPAVLYAMFGLPDADVVLAGGGTVGAAMMVSMCAYGVTTLTLTVFGEELARERSRGWVRTLYATGFPPTVHVAGKECAALVYAGLLVVSTGIVAALAGDVRLPSASWVAFGAVMISGVVIFSVLGLAIAYLARPRAASILTNAVFLPLSFASGFFVPLSQLPGWVSDLAQLMLTYHFGQLAYRIVLPERSIADFTGIATSSLGVHIAWVTTTFGLLGGLTLWAARRETVARG